MNPDAIFGLSIYGIFLYPFLGVATVIIQINFAGQFYDMPDHFWSFSWVKKRRIHILLKVCVLLLWPVDLLFVLLSIVFVFGPIELVKALSRTKVWDDRHLPVEPADNLEVIVTRDDRRSRRQRRQQQLRREVTRR